MSSKIEYLLMGIDNILSYEISSSIQVKSSNSNSMIGMESSDMDFSSGVVSATHHFLKGLDAVKAKALLNGEAYLEFWVKAITHDKPTTNSRIYPSSEVKLALEKPNIINQYNKGGVPCEAEHPILRMYSESEESQMTIFNNLQRVLHTIRDNVSHNIVAHKWTPEATYMKIRTNPGNPVIVQDILAGKRPSFSIRTKADFSGGPWTEPDTGRTITALIANNLTILALDYVANPADVAATASADTFKYIDPLNMKEFDMALMEKGTMGMESDNVLLDSIKPGDKLLFSDKLSPADSLSCMIIKRKTNKPSKEEFTKAFKSSQNFL